MKHFFLLCISLVFSFTSSAQSFSWARSLSGGNYDLGVSVAADAVGNVYSTGYFQDTLDADPGPGTFTLASNGGFDVYISKLDPAGNFVWAASFGSPVYDLGCKIAVDAAGNVLVAGVYTGTVDFNPGPGTYTMGGIQENGFLVKLDPAGNFVWAKNFASNDNDGVYSIAFDAAGNIHLAGAYGATLDFDPGPGTYTLGALSRDIFVCKLDAAGNFLWARSMGGNSLDEPYTLDVDASGNVYTTGYFRGIADFDPGAGTFNLTNLNTNGLGNGFVSKLDASGNFVWAIGYVGTGYSNTNGVGITPSGDVFVSGLYKGSIDFDPSLTNSVSVAQAGDAFVTKISPSGMPVWTNFITGPGDQLTESIAVGASGNIYVAGEFGSTVDFDPGPGVFNLTAGGITDLFLQQLDGMGNLVNVYSVGGPGSDFAVGLDIDASGNIYVTGGYENTVVFDPTETLISDGMADIFVLKFNGCQSLVTVQPVSVSVGPGASVQFGIVSPGTTFQWQQNIGFGFTNVTNGGQFSGATTATLTVSGVGLIQNNNIFRCIVSDNTCSLTSLPAVLNVGTNTAIGELSSQNVLAAYPNPFTSNLLLQVSAIPDNAQYRISDQTGRLVQAGKMEGLTTSVDVSGLQSGLYFIKAGNLNQKPIKIIKQ